MQTSRQKGVKKWLKTKKAEFIEAIKEHQSTNLRQKKPKFKRKPPKRYSDTTKKKIVRYKRPNAVSKKRAAQNREYLKLREQFLKDNPICEVYPYFYSKDVHHKFSGKDRAAHFLDVSTWMAVSREAHNWIHSHPKEARERGWLK